MDGTSGHPRRPKVLWLAAPKEHDFPAAASYLSLLADASVVAATVDALRAAETVTFLAKDILRAARLELLSDSDPHVASHLEDIREGTPLSPILLVRGKAGSGVHALIADGYHRVCATYLADENSEIAVRIVDLPAATPKRKPPSARTQPRINPPAP